MKEKFRDKNILVTGGSGFIGSHLVERLVGLGAKVRVIDNLSTGRKSNLDAVSEQIEFFEGDICDLSMCRRVSEKIDIIFHQAALGSVPRSIEFPSNTILNNVAGTSSVFEAGRDCGVKRIVYASSSSVYGDSRESHRKEGNEGKSLSPYATSKMMNEQLAKIFARCYEMDLVGLRYFNVFGPRQNPNGPYAAVIPKFFDACEQKQAPVIFGDGKQSRDFTFIDDVVRANLMAAASSEQFCGEAYNVGAGGQTTINEIASLICKLSYSKMVPEYEKARPGDVRHAIADTELIFKKLGFSAATSVGEGLKKTFEYMSSADHV